MNRKNKKQKQTPAPKNSNQAGSTGPQKKKAYVTKQAFQKVSPRFHFCIYSILLSNLFDKSHGLSYQFVVYQICYGQVLTQEIYIRKIQEGNEM